MSPPLYVLIPPLAFSYCLGSVQTINARLTRIYQVRYANENDLPFFTVNRAHSMTTTPGQFYGLEIDMQLLTGIDINPDGGSARFQGGMFAQEVIDVLWEQGYVASQSPPYPTLHRTN